MMPTAIIVLSALLVVTGSRNLGLGICYRHELVPKVRTASFYVTNTVTVQQQCGLVKTCEVTQLEYRVRYNNQSYNTWEERAFCCDGYKQVAGGRQTEPLECAASCNPPCEHGDCVAPSHCRCHLGYRPQAGSPTVCIPDCPRGCHNGHCAGPEICACDLGYAVSPDPGYEHYCVPVCRQNCTNGHCIMPDTCLCDQGYKMAADNRSDCKPVCKKTCINSDCVAPDQCSCHESFGPDKKDMSRCNLITSTTTANPTETTQVSKYYCNFSVDFTLEELFDDQACLVFGKPLLIKFERQFMSIESIDCLGLMLNLNASLLSQLSLNCTISRDKSADNRILISCSIYDFPSLEMTNRTGIINALTAVEWITLRIENDLESLDHPLIKSSQGNRTDEMEFIHWNKICCCTNQERQSPFSRIPSFKLEFEKGRHLKCVTHKSTKSSHTKAKVYYNTYLLSSKERGAGGSLKLIVLAILVTVILVTAAAALSYYLWQRHRSLNDPLKYKGVASFLTFKDEMGTANCRDKPIPMNQRNVQWFTPPISTEREVQHRFSNPAYILPSLELISDTEDNSEE